MKKKNNEGFSLVEVLVAIVILAAIVIPACTSLVLSHRINAKTDSMLRSQLAVSSAAEALMAEGINEEYKHENTDPDENYGYIEVPVSNGTKKYVDRFPEVFITINKPIKSEPTEGSNAQTQYHPYYEVKITSKEDPDVSVSTVIRAALAEEPEGG